MDYYIVCHARKISPGGGLIGVSRHNQRIKAYESDGTPLLSYLTHPERQHLNVLDSDPSTTWARRLAQIDAAKLARKPQRNASSAIEITVSASPEWFDAHTPEEWKTYLDAALDFLEKKYGKELLIGCSTHYDEKVPHLHALFVPLTRNRENRQRETGKKRGEKREDQIPRTMGERETLAYSSSTFLGAINGLARLQDEIAEELKDFGVIRGERGSEARHTTQQEWAANVARKDRELKHQAQEQLAKEIEFVDREDRLADREAHARETQEAAEKETAAALERQATADKAQADAEAARRAAEQAKTEAEVVKASAVRREREAIEKTKEAAIELENTKKWVKHTEDWGKTQDAHYDELEATFAKREERVKLREKTAEKKAWERVKTILVTLLKISEEVLKKLDREMKNWIARDYGDRGGIPPYD